MPLRVSMVEVRLCSDTLVLGTGRVLPLVERGSSVGRMPDSQSREPGFESRCYRFEVWAFSFTSRRLSRLSCINEYLAIDSGGNVSAAWLECFPEKPRTVSE